MPSPAANLEPSALGRLPDEWCELLGRLGQPAYRARQVFAWIHRRQVLDPELMTDLPKALRGALAQAGLAPPLALESCHGSADGSRKLLLRLRDGRAVETVLLPRRPEAAPAEAAPVEADDTDEDGDPEPSAAGTRVTQCISTQVGCAMGCVFCASGVAGLDRHLDAGEIVAQILVALGTFREGERLGNVLFMGMGEPLHNYAATARAIRLLTHADGLGLSPRRLTVSTVGLVPAIDRLREELGGKVGLAVSLHHADDAGRSALVPANRRHGLGELVAAIGRYAAAGARPVTIEYTLIAGHNDRDGDAARLARLFGHLPVKVNLIPMNPIAHSALGPSPPERVAAFQARLVDAGVRCFIRRRRADDVTGACGQLARLGTAPHRRWLERQPR